MSRTYDRERYLPWYRRATPTWLELSLGARGALVSIEMELHHETGELHLRRGLPSLAVLLRCDWASLAPALDELLHVGKLTWDDSKGVLSDPDYAERRRAVTSMTGAERTERWRNRRKRDAGDERDDVTSPVTCDDKRREEKRRELTPPTGEYARARELRPEVLPRVGLPLSAEMRGIAAAQIDASGEAVDIDHEWQKYLAHREAKARPVTSADWRGWVLDAIKFCKRDRMRESDRKAANQARYGKAPGLVEHEQRKPPTRAQSKKFLEELAAIARGQPKEVSK